MRIVLAIGAVAIVAALASAPFTVNPGLLFLLGVGLIEVLFALSWNLMFSHAGLASFGHAAFFGIGAYTAAGILHHGLPVDYLLILVLAVLAGGLAAFLVAIVVLRRTTGIQLAVLTLALSQLLIIVIGHSNFLGRDDGLAGIQRPTLHFGLFNLDLNSVVAGYYLILIVTSAASAALWWLASSRYGRAMRAVRIDPERAAFVGINVARQRIAVFTIAGATAALAGALAAPWTRIVTPDSLQWLHSAQPMLATLLGGAGSFWGPVIGVFALLWINYATRLFVGLSEVMVGAILLGVILVAPSGLGGLVASLFKREAATRLEPKSAD